MFIFIHTSLNIPMSEACTRAWGREESVMPGHRVVSILCKINTFFLVLFGDIYLVSSLPSV